MSDYTPSGTPATSSAGSSASMRAELALIQTAVNSKADDTGETTIVTVGTITTGTWNATDIAVADGGTGRSTSTTAYGLIAAGTTATGPHQTLAAGATTEILVGGGASALPVWTAATGSGAPVRATSPALVTPDLGTPTALVGTNITGTAASLTAGTVTTNANLTGHVTSVGNAAVLGSFTHAQLNTAVSDANVAAAGANTDITSLGNLTSVGAVTTIDINGGTIDGTPIGGSSTAAVAGTTGTFSGELKVTGEALLGYGTGAGGTATQATSKGTAVSLNKPCGQITTHNASLAANTTVTFAVNNSLVSTVDTVLLTLDHGTGGEGFSYNVWAYRVEAGGFFVALQNITAGALAEAVPINFAVIKGATS